MTYLLRQIPQKIIHIDMDCFYAAIEIRDNPSLINKPVAVGGTPDERGVLCTCNYEARKYKVHSAMATAYALKLCPELIILPVNMKKYKEIGETIRNIFFEYTSQVEPLSLDEAYLDVSSTNKHSGSATLIAKAIREKIWHELQLIASAGVAPNKFLAKIASGWNKPNNLYVIQPKDVDNFVKTLPIKEIHGIGKVTAQKMYELGLHTCADLQKLSLPELIHNFGKFGIQLYQYCRGIDNRKVEPNRMRKSLSVETTFNHDILITQDTIKILRSLYYELQKRLKQVAANRNIKNLYIKIKFSNFKLTSLERTYSTLSFDAYKNLMFEIAGKNKTTIRLIGIGVHFKEHDHHVFQQIVLAV